MMPMTEIFSGTLKDNEYRIFGYEHASELYYNEIYSPNSWPRMLNISSSEPVPSLVLFTTQIEETENVAILGMEVFGQSVTQNNINFSKLYEGQVVYNFEEKNILSNNITSYLEQIKNKEIKFGGYFQAVGFASRVLKEKTPFAYMSVKQENLLTGMKEPNLTALSNILSMFLVFPNEMEKILKISPLTITKNLTSVEVRDLLEVKNNKVPNTILVWANKQEEPTRIMSVLQTICNNEDANGATIFQKYVSNCKRLQWNKGKRYNPQNKGQLYEKIVQLLLTDPTYRIKSLLDYLVRQSFFVGNFDGQIEEAIALCDYVAMAKASDLTYDKFPSNCIKAHNLMVRNLKALKLSKEQLLAFEKNVKESEKYAGEFQDYILSLPKSPEDLVNEGNSLNHCVAGYSLQVAKAETCIAFLRLKETPQTSLYTVEIKDDKVVQMKGKNNEDVSPDILKIAKKIVRKGVKKDD